MTFLALLVLIAATTEPGQISDLPEEGRAVWNHSGTGAYPGDWDRSAKLLKRAGFNIIIPNMLWAGRAHYKSDFLPESYTYKKYGDQVQQCLDAARKYGLQVHVWKVNYNLEGAPKLFVDELRKQHRLQLSADGEEKLWLCPSNAKNIRLELDSMLEVARKYPIDGLHLDYIRYPDSSHCFCDGCRRRFEEHSGLRVADWPADCRSGERRDEYNDWRCRQITTLVSLLHKRAKQIRPELKISAAVWGAYPDVRKSRAQDWGLWVEKGYLDFVCPMNYTDSDSYFGHLVKSHVKLIDGRIPCYPGIGATSAQAKLSAEDVLHQIEIARKQGAGGFSIFEFRASTAESLIPQLEGKLDTDPNRQARSEAPFSKRECRSEAQPQN